MSRKKLSTVICSKTEQKRIREALSDPDKLPLKDALKILNSIPEPKGRKSKKRNEPA